MNRKINPLSINANKFFMTFFFRDTYYLLSFIKNQVMTSVSYARNLSDWLHVHLPFPRKTHMPIGVPRTGSAAAFPKIKAYHRRQFSLLSCVPFLYKVKEKNKRCLLNSDESKQCQKHSSIKGCASFARFNKYQEGDTEEDC